MKKNNPLISVIVPTYNSGRFIKDCLNSLVNQTYKKIEILIVYRHSKDNTKSIIESYQKRYPNLRVIEQKNNLGPANARNIGILASKGKYISFCDSDDIFTKNKLEKQVEYLEYFEDVGVVYSDYILIDKNGKHIRKVNVPDWDFNKWLVSPYIAFSSVVIRRDLLFEVGLFDDELCSNEDFDLLLRLSKVTTFKKVPGYLVYRRIHESNLSRSILKTEFERYKVYKKHGYSLLGFKKLVMGVLLNPMTHFLLSHPRTYNFVRGIKDSLTDKFR